MVPWSQKTAQMASSFSSTQQGGRRKGRKGKVPFSSASGGSDHSSCKGGGGGGAVLLTGCLVRCGWGVACQRTGGTGRLLGPSPGCCPSCGMGITSPSWYLLLPSLAPPISFPTYRSGSPRSLVLGQEIGKMLAKDALEIILDLGPSFYSCLFMVEKATGGWRPMIDLSPERVCSTNTVQDADHSLCATLRPRGGFPSFHRPE